MGLRLKWTTLLLKLALLGLIWLKISDNHPIGGQDKDDDGGGSVDDLVVTGSEDESIEEVEFVEDEEHELPASFFVDDLNPMPIENSIDQANTTMRTTTSLNSLNSSSSSSSSGSSVNNRNKVANDIDIDDTHVITRKSSFDPIWYLNKYGYLDSSFATSQHQHKRGSLIMYSPGLNMARKLHNEAPLTAAIKTFQKLARLNQTGILDEPTVRMMQMPRCGHPDLFDDGRFLLKNQSRREPQRRVRFRNRRYALQGSKWPKSKLRFRVAKYPKYPSMTHDMIDRELQRAFDLWSDAGDVEFEHVKHKEDDDDDDAVATSPSAAKSTFMDLLLFDESMLSTRPSVIDPTSAVDIEIRFETGYHGDSEPFDGSGLILGHAYFPEFGGSTHFDADEFWTSKSPDGVNLYQVAVHEFGHALGLEHSDNFDAIMAPFFRGYSDDFRLHPDDLTAIELLYGKSRRRHISQSDSSSSSSWSSSSSSTPERDEKDFSLDADTSSQQQQERKQQHHAASNSDTSSKFRNNLPSIYENENDIFAYNNPMPTIIIPMRTTPSSAESFSTTTMAYHQHLNVPQMFRFQETEYAEIPNSLCLDGTFDAISLLSDGQTYVFKDAYVYKFDNNFVMDKDYPKLVNTLFKGWNGITSINLPLKLDTVLYLPENGITYFFKNNLYWRSSRLYELDAGYPRFISENFRGLDARNGFSGRLDASFVWSGNRRVYFVEANKYWRYDFDLGYVEPGYPKKLAIWRGLPANITDALLWINGITYFFASEKYYRFNDLAFKVEDALPVYPRFNVDYWFGCNRYFNKLGTKLCLDQIK